MTTEDSAKSGWWHDHGTLVRNIAAAVPVTLVNATAFVGQFAFLNSHVNWIVPGQVMIAVTIESIAVFLSWHAHLAQMANDSAARLKLGAYSVALSVGAMNYSHYAVHWHPTFEAVLFAMMSAISPALWGVHTKRSSRDQLLARGLIEERGLKVGFNRTLWHPLRALRLQSWSAWHGVNEPKVALAHFAPRYGTPDEPCQVRGTRHAVPDQSVRAVARDVPPAVPAPAPAPAAGAATVPAIAPALVPATTDAVPNQLLPGTQINGVPVVNGTAVLEADAKVSGGRPPQAVIDAAEEYLLGLPAEDLPSVRWLAANKLGDPNQRRLAARLIKKREGDGTGLTGAPPADGPAVPVRGINSVAPGMISTPAGFQPGGAVSG